MNVEFYDSLDVGSSEGFIKGISREAQIFVSGLSFGVVISSICVWFVVVVL